MTEKIKIYAGDCETMSNLFVYCGIEKDTEEKVVFVIHELKNDLSKFLDFCRTPQKQIMYNGVKFDCQVIQWMINNQDELLSLSGEECARAIHDRSQYVIESSNNGDYPEFAEKDLFCPILDLLLLWHFDNRARMTRLKDLEFNMRMESVKDCSIPFTQDVHTMEEIKEVVQYCLHDTKATLLFYRYSTEQIAMRRELSKEYKINFTNYNDAKIGQEILVEEICKRTKQNKWKMKKMRTYHDTVSLSECILSIVEFKSKEFNKILEQFKKTVVRSADSKGGFKGEVKYKDFNYTFGLGGIHGSVSEGVYESNDEFVIKSLDVSSYYPNLCIIYGFRPEHLGDTFGKVFKELYERRKSYPKTDARNKGLKLSLNGGGFGKLNDQYSPFYDCKAFMQVTINGQLLLAMLFEELQDAGFEMYMANTDGGEALVPRNRVDEYKKICDNWMKKTGFVLEFTDYKKMIIADVNNYIAVDYKGKIKQKGKFEHNDIESDEFIAWNKDLSMQIVPIALTKFFVEGIPISTTVRNHKDVFDFCLRIKTKSDSQAILRYLKNKPDLTLLKTDKDDKLPITELDEPESLFNSIKEEVQQKTTRYIITNKGGLFYKKYLKKKTGSITLINKGYAATMLNQVDETKPIEDYDLNYRFYEDECNKIVKSIIPDQLRMNLDV